MKQQLFTFTFSYRKIYILLENISVKSQFILLHLLYSFFHMEMLEIGKAEKLEKLENIGNAVTPTPI